MANWARKNSQIVRRMYSGCIARQQTWHPAQTRGPAANSRPAGHTSPPAELGWLGNLDCYTCLYMLYMVAAHSYVRQLGIGSCQWMHALFSSWADVRETRCHASPAIRSIVLLPEPQLCSLEKNAAVLQQLLMFLQQLLLCLHQLLMFLHHLPRHQELQYEEVYPQLQCVLQRLKKADELSSVDAPAKPSKKRKRDEDEASTSYQADAL